MPQTPLPKIYVGKIQQFKQSMTTLHSS